MQRGYTLTIAFLFCALLAAAQQHKMLAGLVVDSATKQPIPAVSIQCQSSGRSTITNDEGEFIIAKPEEPGNLVFSHISYGTKTLSTQAGSFNVALAESAITLPQVTVIPIQALTKKIWNRYNTIYKANEKRKKKKSQTFFYRQVTQIDTLYCEFIESFFLGQSTYRVEDLQLAKGRSAAVVGTEEEPTFSIANFFIFTQVTPFRPSTPDKNTVNTFLQPNAAELYNISLEQVIESADLGSIYVLSYTPKSEAKKLPIVSGKLFVRKFDLSILKLEAELNDMGLTGSKNWEFLKSTNRLEVSYRYFDLDYPVVESVKSVATIDVKHNEKLHKGAVSSTLFLVDYDAGTAGKKMKKGTNLRETINKTDYDAAFWDNNPIVKRTTLEDRIIESFKSKNTFGSFKP